MAYLEAVGFIEDGNVKNLVLRQRESAFSFFLSPLNKSLKWKITLNMYFVVHHGVTNDNTLVVAKNLLILT